MGFVSLANSIITAFEDVADSNGFEARYDNDPDDTPSSGLWCEVSVNFGSADQKEIGVNSFRDIGSLDIKIRNDTRLGIGAQLSLIDIIVLAFSDVLVDNIVLFRTAEVKKIGRIDDNYEIDITCPFQYDFSL